MINCAQYLTLIDRLSSCNKAHLITNEPPHGKTNNLQRRKQTQISFAVTAKLISAFVFASRIVQFLFYFNPKFQDSSSILRLYRSVCVRPVRKPHCWFSHEAAQIKPKEAVYIHSKICVALCLRKPLQMHQRRSSDTYFHYEIKILLQKEK